MSDPVEPAEDAAVLVPLYRGNDGELRLVVVRRTEGGIHGGQLAFPGGKREPEDQSLVDTALRESREEIGLAPTAVDIVAKLPTVDTIVSGFCIHPYVARIVPPPSWRPEEREIAEVLDVRIDALAKPDAHDEETWHLPEWPRPYQIAFYRVGPHKLWGATYRILHPLLPRLLAGEWNV